MKVINLETPISDSQIKDISTGDHITISGKIFTARDAAHIRAMEYARTGKSLPFETKGGVLYHCGPVARKINSSWEILSAGPTTSARLENVEADFIEKFKIKVIIGKGGMLERTQKALKEYNAIYCAFTGGAGALAANFIQSVIRVEWLDLGIPEAVWILEVHRFGPLLVAIDNKDNNLFDEINETIQKNKQKLLSEI